MATVTGLTAQRMLEIEAMSIVNGGIDLVTGRLKLERHDGGIIDAGDVRGVGLTPGGDTGSAFFKKSDNDYDAEWRTIHTSDVGAGVFDPARMAHIRSDSSKRAWFTTDPTGGWGGEHTTLAMSPPTDATWTNALDLRVNNSTKFAISKDGVLTSVSIPAGLVNSGRLDVAQVPLLTYVPSTGRSYLSTAESGTVTGATMSYLGISPPGDGNGLFWLVTSGTTPWAIDKTGTLTTGNIPTTRLSGRVGYVNLPNIVASQSSSPPYAIFGVNPTVYYDTNTTALRMSDRSGATTGERFAFYDSARKILMVAHADSVGDYMAILAAYTRTTTAAANMVVFTSAGAIARSTSLRAAKVSIEDAPEDWAEKVWSLRPRTWFDKTDADIFADALDRQASGDEVEWDEVATAPLRRIPGFVAEEVEEAGLEEFLSRDETGALTGLAYDRFSAALLVAMKDEREKRLAAEARLDMLEARLAALEASATPTTPEETEPSE